MLQLSDQEAPAPPPVCAAKCNVKGPCDAGPQSLFDCKNAGKKYLTGAQSVMSAQRLYSPSF